MLLTDLADAARKSGLKVVELDGWQHNYSNGDFDPDGTLCHHTGSYDSLTDATDDLGYAKWLAFTGRDVSGDGRSDPPLCNLAFSAECVVYVCAAGNANHAGYAQSSGPMPSANDGNALYIGIEAMNSGSQGWDSKGHTADGEEITQGEGYARLCAALANHYAWPADHTRGHKETSITGKWDPGLLDMDSFRDRIAALMNGDDDMAYNDWPKADRDALVSDVAAEVVKELLAADLFPKMKDIELTVQAALKGKAPTKAEN